jgi:hypothetical protein
MEVVKCRDLPANKKGQQIANWVGRNTSETKDITFKTRPLLHLGSTSLLSPAPPWGKIEKSMPSPQSESTRQEQAFDHRTIIADPPSNTNLLPRVRGCRCKWYLEHNDATFTGKFLRESAYRVMCQSRRRCGWFAWNNDAPFFHWLDSTYVHKKNCVTIFRQCRITLWRRSRPRI